MPTYTFINEQTRETEEHFMSISSLDGFKQAHPQLKQYFAQTPPVVSGVNSKPDGGFREVLQRIKSANRGSNINTF